MSSSGFPVINTPQQRRKQTLIWTGAGIVLLLLFYVLSPMLTPFAIAAVFAYICDPVVGWLVAKKMPRAVAVSLVIVSVILALVILLGVFVPMFIQELISLLNRLPDLLEKARDYLLPLLHSKFDIEFTLDMDSIKNWLIQNSNSIKSMLPGLLTQAQSGGIVLLSLITNIILVPIVMFYLLQEWPRITHSLQTAIPRPMLPRTMKITREINSVLSEFLRGQLTVMFILAVFYSIGLSIAGLHFAIPVGVLTGILSFIPFVGFGGGLTLAMLAALLQGEGWMLLVWVGIVYAIGQVLESYVLTPYMVGERIGLHPLAVIFSLMAFGQLFGFVGMLVALPASAAILVGLREVRTAWFNSSVYLGTPK